MYISLLFIILATAGILLLIEDINQKWNRVCYWAIGLCLILAAAFRPEGMDNDFYNYAEYITKYDDPRYELVVEWSFRFISQLFMTIFGYYRSVFILFAVLGVSIKLYAIRKISPCLFAPLCIYIGNYFILHEFTQIRAGIAAGFLILALWQIHQQQKAKALLMILAATFFHYSSLIFLVTLFLSQRTLTPRMRLLWAMIVPISYFIAMFHLQLTSLPIPYFGDKMEAYQTLRDQGYIDEINIFNLLLLLKIAIYLLLLWFYPTIEKNLSIFPLMIRLMGISIFSFLVLSDLPVLSFRVSEMFGIVELFLFPSLIFIVSPRWVGKMMIIFLSFSFLFLRAFIDKILVVM